MRPDKPAQSFEHLIGTSPAIRALEAEIDHAARSDAKVLITGESGVGKEVVARLIHRQSPRNRAPLVTLNCASVPDSLLESELFGHVRGSFTDAYRDRLGLLQMAAGGTIFMDEVGEMSLRMQGLLLRFLESGEIQRVGADRTETRVDVRVLTATNRNLLDRVARGEFREDLYYRLNVIHIWIPPLRERREDILPLLRHFLQSYSARYRVECPQLSAEASALLVGHDWPGNVRELKNIVERLVVRRRAEVVTPADLPPEVSRVWRSANLPAEVLAHSKPDILFRRMVSGGESFWSAVYAPFMSRDLTREDLRLLIGKGLEQTRGSYRLLVQLFNMDGEEYKRFLSFLRKHQCHLPFQRFRAVQERAPLPADRRSREKEDGTFDR